MIETPIFFTSGALRIEGMLERAAATKAAVITHPHPLFGPPAPIPNLQLIVNGERAEIAPPAMVDRVRPRWNPAAAFKVIPGAGHFYSGCLKILEDMITVHI